MTLQTQQTILRKATPTMENLDNNYFMHGKVLKESLERRLYQIAKDNHKYVGNSGIISGPNSVRHIRNARDFISPTPNSTITLIDINDETLTKAKNLLDGVCDVKKVNRPKTWGSVRRDAVNNYYWPAEELLLNHNVKYECCDISKATTHRFMDADLMTTYKTVGGSLSAALIKQADTYKPSNLSKIFIFTLGLRPLVHEETFKWVEKEFFPILGFKTIIDWYDFDSLANDPATKMFCNRINNFIYKRFYNKMRVIKQGRVDQLYLFGYNDRGGSMLTGLLAYK